MNKATGEIQQVQRLHK